jgi:hypothetical protein
MQIDRRESVCCCVTEHTQGKLLQLINALFRKTEMTHTRISEYIRSRLLLVMKGRQTVRSTGAKVRVDKEERLSPSYKNLNIWQPLINSRLF